MHDELKEQDNIPEDNEERQDDIPGEYDTGIPDNR